MGDHDHACDEGGDTLSADQSALQKLIGHPLHPISTPAEHRLFNELMLKHPQPKAGWGPFLAEWEKRVDPPRGIYCKNIDLLDMFRRQRWDRKFYRNQ